MSKKSKYPEVSVYSVLPKPIIQTRSMAQTQPNSINLDDAIQYLKTLPEEDIDIRGDKQENIDKLLNWNPDTSVYDTYKTELQNLNHQFYKSGLNQ